LDKGLDKISYSLVLLLMLFGSGVYAQQRRQLSGGILDSLRRPIPDATVTLYPDNKVFKTDKNGVFSFQNLYEGTYQLVVSAVGYYKQEQDVTLEGKNIRKDITLIKENNQIEAVGVTAKIRAVDNLLQAEQAAMPVKVITRREIELMGSRRLDEVMKEQTGVAVVNDIAGGSRAIGVQIQGFSSNYVMVLVDGQPMLGRNNGNFDLSRISVTNIERIEIIKGASSCLYGSDALGGAINIITRHGAVVPQAMASVLYGNLNIVDATVEAETPFANQRGSMVVSGNYYRTDGFNTDKKYMTLGTTVAPYDNYSFQGRLRYRTSKNGTLGATFRYAERNSTMLNGWSQDLLIKNTQRDQDLNLSASYDHQFNANVRSMSRYYFTRFQNTMDAQWVKQGALAGADQFGQQVHRVEQQLAYTALPTLKFVGGLGGSIEQMDDKQLDGTKSLQSAFAYLQTEWKASEQLNTTLGLRYDYTNVYAGRLSPSVGLQYALLPTLTLKAGSGMGFKAPDYKMRYQVFYNAAANYMVVGSDRVREVINALDQQGELSYVNRYMLNLAANNLKAEKSWSNNIGFIWEPTRKSRTEFSVFYHRINNQINNVSVGNGTSINQIYTYRNLPKAMNTGFEVSTSYQVTRDIEVSAGYQYLIAKDLSVLDSIRSGKYPYNQTINNPITGESRPPKPSDYWGIEDRSRHMLNLKVLYTYRPLDMNINLRANIRGKYAFQETSGNQFIDKYDAFVPAHTLLNLTVEKAFWNRKLTVRLIADNLLNFTHMYMLGQPGRVILGGLSYRWIKN